ncbi:hypothetical protein QFZ68_002016 [Streptomyces sp. V1I6]|nr:hypothetical protein [Streptomyces sp. V1I6]
MDCLPTKPKGWRMPSLQAQARLVRTNIAS